MLRVIIGLFETLGELALHLRRLALMEDGPDKLPDLLEENLNIIFCGTAASRKSAQKGAYYAGPGNRFWPTLYEVGFIPKPLQPLEFRSVLEYGIGLTDLAKKASGMDHQIAKEAFDRDALERKIIKYQPRLLALTSKNAAKLFFQTPKVEYGPNVRIGKTQLWVLPSPSGAAKRAWDIEWWRRLAKVVADLKT